MGSSLTHLPFPAIRKLPDTYWEDEASVNGIWNGLIAAAYQGTNGYVIQPEGKTLSPSDSQKRNDLLVRQINGDPEQGETVIRLVFEGKSSKSRDTLDAASKQLSVYLESAGYGSLKASRGKIWCIVAKGKKWRAYQYNGNMIPLSLGSRRAILKDQKPSAARAAQEMDVKENPEVALHFLQWFQANPTTVLRII